MGCTAEARSTRIGGESTSKAVKLTARWTSVQHDHGVTSPWLIGSRKRHISDREGTRQRVVVRSACAAEGFQTVWPRTFLQPLLYLIIREPLDQAQQLVVFGFLVARLQKLDNLGQAGHSWDFKNGPQRQLD